MQQIQTQVKCISCGNTIDFNHGDICGTCLDISKTYHVPIQTVSSQNIRQNIAMEISYVLDLIEGIDLPYKEANQQIKAILDKYNI